jgi:hypothetical protein
MTGEHLDRRAKEYANRHQMVIGPQLGSGVHGIVFAAEHQIDSGRSAIKIHHREADYARERDVYLRLQELEVTEIHGCNVPEMIHFDDVLCIIEMTIVKRPFVLDFAGAFLDRAPDFSDEVLADWQAEKKEQFSGRWSDVQAVLRSLQGHGIHMVDVNPGNISFGD